MSIQIFDSENNLILPNKISVQAQNQIVNSSGNLINPSTSENQEITNNHLNIIKDKVNQLNFTSDGKLKVDTSTVMLSEVEIKNDEGNPIPIFGSVTQSGQWNINNITGTISLPIGAATSEKQDITNNVLVDIKNKTDNLTFNENKLLVEANVVNSVEVEVKNDNENPIPVNVQNQFALENGNIALIKTNTDILTNRNDVNLSTRASESTLFDISNKIGEVQNNPSPYTLLDRIKSIYEALYEIFNGKRLLGLIRNRNDFSDNVIHTNTINLAANASSIQINIGVVPTGQEWHVISFGLGRSGIISTNNTTISRAFLRKNGKNIFVITSDGNYTQADVRITFFAGEMLSYLVTNGGAASNNYINIVYEVKRI
ncbi:MAG: hypothetical protein QXL51_00335 [Candidatus Aenigmatarchaeota archaeon]